MKSAAGPIHLLIVDDNVVDRERVRRLLGPEYETSEAATADEALRAADGADCILLDYRLPDDDGLSILDRLAGLGAPVIMLTGQGDERVAVEAMKRGAHDYLVKGAMDAVSLQRAIASALETHSLRRQLQAQQAELQRRVGELRMVLGQLPATLWTTDRELRCSSLSGTAQLLGVGPSDVIGKRIDDGFEGEDRHRVLAAHQTALRGEPTSFDVGRGDRLFQAHVEAMRDEDGRPAGVIGVALDVTETSELEKQLRRAQKMEALGQLAGGIAHDFNNLLTVIISFTQFVKEATREEDPVSEDLDEVLSAADRGAVLVRQLLAFSRRRAVEPDVVDPNAVVRDLLPMLRRLLGEDVIVRFEPAGDLWTTRIDPGGLEQIVVNLTVNARDAMTRGGLLDVSTRNMSVDEKLSIGQRAELPPGEYVVIAVSDEGDGIPPAIREKIFEPFFTTKGVGDGTGLGLSTCYGIARQAGGTISVYSEVGRGTTFRIYLPRSDEQPAPRERAAVSLPHGHGEAILVVEDDPQVRALVVRTLRRVGYEVVEAASSADAVEQVSRRGADIRLLLTDVVMPDLSGPELVHQLGPGLRGARTLYMSGYADAAIRQRKLLDADAHLLEKPFSPSDLARRVREVLDG